MKYVGIYTQNLEQLANRQSRTDAKIARKHQGSNAPLMEPSEREQSGSPPARNPLESANAEYSGDMLTRCAPYRRSGDHPAAKYILQRSDFAIRLAALERSIDRVDMLVTRAYRQRGYKTDVLPFHACAGTAHLKRVTLEACRNDCTVGTITVGLDSPAGLHAEDLYRDEVHRYRNRSNSLCEFNRLALDIEKCGKELLGNLFHLAFMIAYHIHQATDLFIEINPRHAVFYRRKLGFEVIGRERICRRVDAPALLLHQKFSWFHEQIVRYGGLKNSQNRSFYAYFMTQPEEQHVLRQIRSLLLPDRHVALNSDAVVA